MTEDEYQQQLNLNRLTQGIIDDGDPVLANRQRTASWVNSQNNEDQLQANFEAEEEVEVKGMQDELTFQTSFQKEDDIIVEFIVDDGLRIIGHDAYSTNLIIYSKILGEAEATTFLQKYAAQHNGETVKWESGFKAFEELKPGVLKVFRVSASTIAQTMGESGKTTDGFVEDALQTLQTERARKFLQDHLQQAVKPDTKRKLLYVSMAKMIDEFNEEEWKAYEEYKDSKTNKIPTTDFAKVFAQFQKYYKEKIRPKKLQDRKQKKYRPGNLPNPFKCRLFHTEDAEQLIYTYYKHPQKGHDLGIDKYERGSYGVYVRIIKMALNEFLRFHPDYKPLPLTLAYDKATYDAVYLFQQISKIETDGTIGKETLRQLDLALYNKRNTRKDINEEALVWSDGGVSLLQTPSSEGKVLVKIPFNGKMLVHEETFPGWYKVTYSGTVNGAKDQKAAQDADVVTGYVKAHQVKLGLGPDKRVKLHEVVESSLEEIINREYNPDAERDRSFYANALLYYNNDYGRGGVFLKDKQGNKLKFEGNGEHYPYDQIHTNKGAMIWLPSEAFMKTMKDSRWWVNVRTAIREGYAAVNKTIGDFLARYMPEGAGVYLEAELGVTAFSLGGDLEGGFYVYRKGNNLVIERRSIVRIGLDVGAGAGAFYSTTKYRNTDQNHGQGGEVGVNAMLKAKTILFQTYNFDLHKEILPAFLVLSNSDNKGNLKYLMALLFSYMAKLGLNTDNFLVKSKFGVGLEARAAASASAGLRLGKEKMNPTPYGKNNYADNRQGSSYSKLIDRWLNLFNIKLGLQLGAEGMVGKEVEFADAEGNPAKFNQAKYMNLNIYRELKIEAGVSLPFWAFLFKPSLLPLALMPKLIGVGVKEKYRLDLKTEKIEHVKNAVYLQTGEIDYYVANASEIELDIDKRDTYQDIMKAFYNFDDEKFIFDADLFKKMVKQIQIKKRVSYAIQKGKMYKQYRTYTGVKRLLTQKPSTTYGAKVAAFATFEFQLQDAHLDDAVKAAVALAETIAKDLKKEKNKNDINVTGYIWQQIMQFMATGHVSDKVWPLIDVLFDKQVIQSADLMIQLGAGMGFGAKAGAAVKFRGQGFVSGGVIRHIDISGNVQKFLTKERGKAEKAKGLGYIFSAKST